MQKNLILQWGWIEAGGFLTFQMRDVGALFEGEVTRGNTVLERQRGRAV